MKAQAASKVDEEMWWMIKTIGGRPSFAEAEDTEFCNMTVEI